MHFAWVCLLHGVVVIATCKVDMPNSVYDPKRTPKNGHQKSMFCKEITSHFQKFTNHPRCESQHNWGGEDQDDNLLIHRILT